MSNVAAYQATGVAVTLAAETAVLTSAIAPINNPVAAIS